MTISTSRNTDSNSTRHNVRSLQERPNASVLIVGGGINGIAAFTDLALQGVDVALVERGDYASGASSASSHMIHGGIRYLENGEFRLVKEAVQERNALLRTAPHYVKPLPTTMPIFSTFSGLINAPLKILLHRQVWQRDRGAFIIKIGMSIYDSFSRDGGSVPRHIFKGHAKALEEMPELNPEVKYTGTYYDASVYEPERLALDLLKDGLAEGGENARAANYVEVVGSKDGAVVLRDNEGGSEFEFKADVIVNVSGPWTDLTNQALGEPTRYMGGTKGSHIVVDHPELLEATKGHELYFENSDGRTVLIYPIKGRVMIGTTDIDADPSKPVHCTDEEIEYFFDLVKHVFPQIVIDQSQIVFSFSGIRPLPRHEDTAPGFVSRDYRIVDTEVKTLPDTKVFSLVGGKWTTFRASGEALADRVLKTLNLQRKVSTRNRPIGGGAGYPKSGDERTTWIKAHESQVYPEAFVSRLLDRYGTRAADVLQVIEQTKFEPLKTDPEFTKAEISYLASHEQAVHLLDVILRRTNLAFVGGVTREYLDEIAEILAETLGWDADRLKNEVDKTIKSLQNDHGVSIKEGSHNLA